MVPPVGPQGANGEVDSPKNFLGFLFLFLLYLKVIDALFVSDPIPKTLQRSVLLLAIKVPPLSFSRTNVPNKHSNILCSSDLHRTYIPKRALADSICAGIHLLPRPICSLQRCRAIRAVGMTNTLRILHCMRHLHYTKDLYPNYMYTTNDLKKKVRTRAIVSLLWNKVKASFAPTATSTLTPSVPQMHHST
ncbi:hypothetical protein BC939DRAFT_40156 [Gamsiella multidivaricata]|uniref:uncharacterized protein n=1 Tax=Gamsiella multidivaricata TaxID=101098 RepID=UPI00221FB8B6|nr:uncharacterized protein BC939DRAFT_40156 [Gamsiella multidivaricata]KAI7829011.1 hypothetical protein BC939DRAFT_40156 [Gamsiella multidivaricata]